MTLGDSVIFIKPKVIFITELISLFYVLLDYISKNPIVFTIKKI